MFVNRSTFGANICFSFYNPRNTIRNKKLMEIKSNHRLLEKLPLNLKQKFQQLPMEAEVKHEIFAAHD